MSGAFKGRDVDFSWRTVDIPGVRQKGITLNGEAIDVTSDENNGIRTLLSTSSQDQIDLAISGVVKTSILRDDWMQGNRVQSVVIEYPDGATITGDFYLASYVETGVYNDAVTFDATLQSTGAWTYSPYA